jgi:hypothetical protein
MMETCENCGLPSDAIAYAGFAFALETRPDNKYQHRSTKHRVRCCSKECVIQALAQNKYGPATHKWLVTLAEFRQLEGEPFFRGLTVTKCPPQTRINTGSDEGLFEKVALPPTEGFRNASGRPKTYPTAAARQRAYRDRQRASV